MLIGTRNTLDDVKTGGNFTKNRKDSYKKFRYFDFHTSLNASTKQIYLRPPVLSTVRELYIEKITIHGDGNIPGGVWVSISRLNPTGTTRGTAHNKHAETIQAGLLIPLNSQFTDSSGITYATDVDMTDAVRVASWTDGRGTLNDFVLHIANRDGVHLNTTITGSTTLQVDIRFKAEVIMYN